MKPKSMAYKVYPKRVGDIGVQIYGYGHKHSKGDWLFSVLGKHGDVVATMDLDKLKRITRYDWNYSGPEELVWEVTA